MNATLLYTYISQEMFSFDRNFNENILLKYMAYDSDLLKLKNLLICRGCRKVSKEPYSSNFCQHLICKSCLLEGGGKNFGCKWCRNNEYLIRDNQSDIIIILFKKLCAIMEDVITQSIKTAGRTEVKEKFLMFLENDCNLTEKHENSQTKSLDNGPSHSNHNEEYTENISKSILPKPNACIDTSSQTDEPFPPIISCQCKNSDDNDFSTDLSNHPITITQAESSTMRSENNTNLDLKHGVCADDVTSTVPDKLPDPYRIKQISPADDHEIPNGRVDLMKDNTANLQKQFTDIKDKESSLKSDNVYETIAKISLKSEKKNRSIFEKFGLALSPPSPKSQTTKHKRKKKKGHRENSNHNSRTNTESEPKVLPLKLKMRKINTENSDESSYLVQYDIEKVFENDEENDKQFRNDNNQSGNDQNDNFHENRKVKRKATFISDYTIFSDDSDFEEETSYSKNQNRFKRSPEKLNRDICGCGAGSNVKYFTDICKRARCPCFSQGRACVNCRCRFCSNPYILEEEEEEVYSESDSSNVQDLDNVQIKDESEMIDVETM